MTDPNEAPAPPDVTPEPPAPAKRRMPRARWLVLGVVGLVAAGAGLYAWLTVNTLLSAKYQDISYTVPSAPKLSPAPGETIFRIDPGTSQVSYSVEEKIVGQGAHRAVGVTNGIAGDLALNNSRPALSRVGDIVVNVEQLHSDNRLRDGRIRQEFLESHANPLVTFHMTSLTGMPASVSDGKGHDFTLTGTMVVKGKPYPVVWKARGSVADGKMHVSATANVKMSDLGIGPISLVGLVSTSDDVALTMSITAVDPSRYTVTTQIAAPAPVKSGGKSPSYKQVVAPILAANCASCHNTGQVGAAHWKLDTAADASNVATGLETVVASRYMPPWPASHVGVPLAGSKALTQAQIDSLVSWVRAGSKLDVPASTPVKAPPPPAAITPRKDITMRSPVGYAGTLAVENDYRCFVFNPNFTSPTWMTGYQVTPDQRAEIHHVQVFHVTKAELADAATKDGKDGKPGWSCYGGPGLSAPRTPRPRGPLTADQIAKYRAARKKSLAGGGSAGGQEGLVAGWVPGQDPVVLPKGVGLLFQPGDALVFQIHYHYTTTPVPDRTSLSIQTESGTHKLKGLVIVNPLAPVEIPCMPGQTAPLCDRTAALADDVRQYGSIGSYAENGLLALCGESPEKMTAGFNGVARSTCDYKVPVTGTIIGAMGHMHTLGSTFRFTLNPDTPKKQVLLDIPLWNFGWQMNYGLQNPIHVTAGETIRMECSWDRSIDPNRPAKYIVFAEGTEDEMCFGTYSIVPDGS